MFLRHGFVPDQKEVLIVSLHKIFFPGILFQQRRVCLQLLQLLFGGSDLLLVILLALLQFQQFSLLPEMTCDKVAVIKKQYPDGKSCRRQQVLVL